MNLGPAFQFYSNDFLGSDHVQLMSLDEVGAYLLLLIFQWNSGYVPADIPKLGRICKNAPTKKMAAMWVQISPCFQPSEIPGQLVNPRMEQLRSERIAYLESRAESGRAGGIKSGEARAKQKGSTPSVLLEAKSKHERTSPSPSPSPSPNGEESINLPNLMSAAQPQNAPAEKRAGASDPAADFFAAKCLEYTRVPYVFKAQDFVHLAHLRKAYKIGTKDTPDGWDEAVPNYFASPPGPWTIADLAVRYSVFRNSPTDRFKTPINHTGGANGSRETDYAKNNRAVKNFIDRAVAAEVRSDVPDVREDAGGFPRKV